MFDGLSDRVRSILWMLLTYFGFVVLDAIVKYLMEGLPLVQAVWARFFFATVFAALYCGRQLPQYMKTDAPLVQGLRSVFLMACTGLFFAALAHVQLATAATIMFLTPIIVTLASVMFLGEHVGWRRWVGIGAGFLGAFIIIDPVHHTQMNAANIGALLLVIAAASNAGYQVATRYLRHDHPVTSLLFTAAAGAIASSLVLPWYWVWPTPLQWFLMILAGAVGTLSHACIIRAYSLAPAPVIAPFAYSSLIWATLFGFLFWNEFPTSNVWVGATLIVAAGLYIFFRETKVKGESKP